MTLANLEGKTLEAVLADKASIARLLEAADRSLSDARLPGISVEGAFDMAYKAIMQTASVALQASGYRTLTSKPGHHQTLIQTLPLSVGLDTATMVRLDILRKQRNSIDYSGDVVSRSMTDDCLRHASQLLQRVREWLKLHHPELL